MCTCLELQNYCDNFNYPNQLSYILEQLTRYFVAHLLYCQILRNFAK